MSIKLLNLFLFALFVGLVWALIVTGR